MSVYLIKGKGWRYDFTLEKQRYTQAWYKTKTEARQAEAEKRKEVLEPKKGTQIRTDMGFLELVNRRLDHVKSYNSEKHYNDYRYLARRWIEGWGQLRLSEMTQEMIEQFILERSKVSPDTANKEIRYLRAMFNFGKKRQLISQNPTDGIDFLPVKKLVKYVPPPEDIDKVIAVADQDTQDYLWTIRDTMARGCEVNRLTWDDVNLKDRYVVLYTRKKKGGHLTPRQVPMTGRLFDILSRRHSQRDPSKPWIFWHTYWSRKSGTKVYGPYKDRKKFMKTLCRKAGVKYFRFHALRHSGASVMENNNVPIGSIQRILGHENRKTTEIYLHSIGQAEREAVTILEHASGNTHTTLTHNEKGLRLVRP
jgi:integrase